MPKEKGSEGDVKESAGSVKETAVGENSQGEAKPETISNRDALEVALIAVKDKEDGGSKEKVEKEKPQSSQERGETVGGVVEASGAAETVQLQALSAPAEYTTEEKADFSQLSRKGQEAQLRLHRSRQGKIEEIKTAMREHEGLKKLSEAVNPYLRAMGVKEPSEVALQKALKMWREFEDGDPKAAAAAYLKAKGIEPPKELLDDTQKVTTDDSKILPLQEKLNALESRIVREDRARAEAVLSEAWTSFEQEKNAGGAKKYPDLANTESGLNLAANIGSLVNGNTDLSKQFIANVKNRIPDLTYQKLLFEAYRYCGGKVDDSEAPRTQDPHKHIVQSRRAASSVPGKGAPVDRNGSAKKFATYKEAAAAAIAELKD